MIKPINNCIQIDPVEHSSYVQSDKVTYEEIGIVLEVPDSFLIDAKPRLEKGMKVYFDSWMAAKYPKGSSQSDGFYWLVPYENIKAYEQVS